MSQFPLEIQTQAQDLLQAVKALKVTSEDTMAEAASYLTQIATVLKRIEAKRKEEVSPLNAQVDAINSSAKVLTVPLKNVDDALRFSVEGYRRMLREKAQEEESRRQRVLEAKLKIQAQQQAAALLAAAVAMDAEISAGEPLAVVPVILQIVPAAPAVAPSKTLHVETGSVTGKLEWTFEVENPILVPRPYLEVNESLIRKAVRAGAREIQGVRIYQRDVISVRG